MGQSERRRSRQRALPRLRYVSDEEPGIRRLRRRNGFVYTDPDGQQITGEDELQRIRSMAIPPAWEDVWICPVPNGHLLATGRDGRGRKQYRYHPKWREVRDREKYEHTLDVGRALPAVRRRIDADLRRPGLPREKVLATVVALLESTLIRVGNDEYRRANGSYGLTTLHRRHVDVTGSRIRFHFRGKGGREHDIDVSDRRLANVVRRMSELPGQSLFQYTDDEGVRRRVDSGDVNEYLRETAGIEITAKDLRTWWGSVYAILEFARRQHFESKAEAERQVREAINVVAARMGNTPAVCRKCYVHPAAIDRFMDGTLAAMLERELHDAADHADGRDAEEVAAAVLEGGAVSSRPAA